MDSEDVRPAHVFHRFSPGSPISNELSLGSSDSLKLTLTTTEDKTPKRPHQALLTLTDPATGLEDSFALSVKESGKAKLDLVRPRPYVSAVFIPKTMYANSVLQQTHRDIPIQLLTSSKALTATLTLASFGTVTPYRSSAFTLAVIVSSTTLVQPPPPPARYSALPEIHHIFKPDPTSPPVFITAVFGCMVFAALPVLLGTWLELGMNVGHMPEAFKTAPAAHGVFWGSIVMMEIVFFLYYVKWNLFQTLPTAGVVGGIAFLSGSRALREVQGRRLAGKR